MISKNRDDSMQYMKDTSLNKLILKACEQAVKSKDFKYSHHGAVIANREGEILSIGYNKKGNLSKLKKYGYNGNSIHAEADAILSIMNKKINYHFMFNPLSIIIVRFKNGKLQNSRPCKECLKLLDNKSICKIYYSDKDGNMIYYNTLSEDEFYVEDVLNYKLKTI